MFLLGIVWFGRAFNIYSTITQAAQQGAIVAARPACAVCAPPADAWNSTSFPGNTTVDNAVFAVMRASNLDPAQIPATTGPPTPLSCLNPPITPCTTTANVTVCRNVTLNSISGLTQPPQCGAIVSFQYPFQFYLPFTSLNLRGIVLTAQAQSRMEN